MLCSDGDTSDSDLVSFYQPMDVDLSIVHVNLMYFFRHAFILTGNGYKLIMK